MAATSTALDCSAGEGRYYDICKRLKVAPDSSFLIALRTRARDCKFSRRITEADLLAISEFLVPEGTTDFLAVHPSPCHIPARWDLSGTLVGSNGAGLIARMIRAKVPIESVSLANTQMGPRGFRYIAEAIMAGAPPTLRRIDLSSNSCYRDAAKELAKAIAAGNHSLEHIDVHNCHTTFPGELSISRAVASVNSRRAASVSKLTTADSATSSSSSLSPSSTPSTSQLVTESPKSNEVIGSSQNYAPPREMTYVVYGNVVREELENSITHGVGLIAAIIGSVVLLLNHRDQPWERLFSAVVFLVSLILVYTCSCVYHSFFKVISAKNVLRRFDHLAIFLLIAGTYTPMAVIPFHGKVGWTLLAAVWGLGLAGICMDLFFFNMFPKTELTIYLSMGWLCCLVALPAFTHPAIPMTHAAVFWLAAGGFFYTSGVVFFVLDDVLLSPKMHVLWHLFVMAGSLCHWICINNHVMTMPYPNPPCDQFFYSAITA